MRKSRAGSHGADASSATLAEAARDAFLGQLGRDRLEFRILNAGEISDESAREMLDLYQRCFGRWPGLGPGVSALEHLQWKMSAPASELGAIHGRLDGRLVYAATALSDWVRIRGRRRLRLILVDASVEPSCRGQGVYSRSVTYRSSAARYRCDLSLHERSPSARLEQRLARTGHRRLGNRITKLIRVLDPRAPLDGMPAALRSLRFLLAAASAAGGSVRAAFDRDPSPSTTRATIRQFDERFDTLFEAAAASFDYIGERTSEFLRWRYGDRRGGPYAVGARQSDARLLGWFVLRTDGSRAYLVDLLALPERPDVVTVLVADAIALARARGASQLVCWQPRRHPYRGAFLRRGFFDSRRDPGVGFHAVDMPPEELSPLAEAGAAIQFGLGDTDLA